MSREKGQPKTGGRAKGTPNMVTREVRKWIFDVVQDNMEKLENDLKTLEPKERWAIIERILPYIVTKKEQNMLCRWEFGDDEWEAIEK